MSARLLLTFCSLALLAASGAPRADIYTWIDASGTMNVSNVAPPDGVKVTNVLRTTAQSQKASAAAADAARTAQVRELTERVRELEQEVQSAKNAPPPDFQYPPMMMQPPAPYAMNRMPPAPAPQYVMDTTPPWNGYGYGYGYGYGSGCDPGWAGCWSPYGAPLAYPGVVVVSQPSRHHHHPSRGGGRPPGSHGPMMAARIR